MRWHHNFKEKAILKLSFCIINLRKLLVNFASLGEYDIVVINMEIRLIASKVERFYQSFSKS